MTLQILDVEQGTPEWDAARRGMVTASVVGQLLTSSFTVAHNDTSRALTAHLTAERITDYTEPNYVSADMERGNNDEPIARDHYSEHVSPVRQCGFMVNTFGYPIGYSPDGLVGTDGLIEIKSRRQKKHLDTILTNAVPPENMSQIQAGLLVSGRAWCDYVSWCGGMPMWVIRVYPNQHIQEAIIQAVAEFEETAATMIARYEQHTDGLPATERGIDLYTEMTLNGHH